MRHLKSLAVFVASGIALGTGTSVSGAHKNKVADGAAPAKPAIDQLISQLGSERFTDREQATRELSQLGKNALPALKEAVKSSDAEVRRRAKGLVELILRSSDPQPEQPMPAGKIYL
jgi:hypothetical protein